MRISPVSLISPISPIPLIYPICSLNDGVLISSRGSLCKSQRQGVFIVHGSEQSHLSTSSVTTCKGCFYVREVDYLICTIHPTVKLHYSKSLCTLRAGAGQAAAPRTSCSSGRNGRAEGRSQHLAWKSRFRGHHPLTLYFILNKCLLFRIRPPAN